MVNLVYFMKAFIWVGLILFISSCKHQTSDQSRMILEMDQFILDEIENNHFSGSIVIGYKDSIIYTAARGIADRNWNITLSTDHRFDIASVNKSFIAALILLASEEGKLHIHNSVNSYLKPIDNNSNFLNDDITIHQLLTHTSGIGDYDNLPLELKENNFLKFKRQYFSNNAYVNFISRIPSLSDPDKQFSYSNFGYHLLTIVLEEIYQKSFAHILTEKICNPLGLVNTFSPQSNSQVYSNMAEGYRYLNGAWQKNSFIDFSLGRRIYSTAEDLCNWVIALQSDYLLSQDSRDVMFKNHLSHLTQDVSYGYGWVVFDRQNNYKMGNLSLDKNYIIHGGSTEGFKSMVVSIENGDIIISILSNSGNQFNEIEFTKKVIDILKAHRAL